MDKLFVNAMADEIVNLTDKYQEQIRNLKSTLHVYKGILNYPDAHIHGPIAATWCLIIRACNLDYSDDAYRFWGFDWSHRHIYALSDDDAVLESFKQKILMYTPETHRNLLDISVVDIDTLNGEEYTVNFPKWRVCDFKINHLYVDSIENLNKPAWSIEEFTRDKWVDYFKFE